MFTNFFITAIRNIRKNKIFSLINITCLAVGMACSILILLFVRYELSYDRFHNNADNIYRLAIRASAGGTKINQTFSSAANFTVLTQDYPEIISGVKILNVGQRPVICGPQTYYENNILAADSTFFDIFSFVLQQGNPKTALIQPNSLVITEETALKYFDRVNVIGEMLDVDLSSWGYGIQSFLITGISENVPDNSHFRYNLLVSTTTFPRLLENKGWSANNFITYFLLHTETSEKEFATKLAEFARENMGGEDFDAWVAQGNYWEYFLQPLTDIHLNSDLNGEFEANGNKTYVYIFSVICVIILLIACINFMNLSTAKSSLRAREVGVRKVVGSTKGLLIKQFISESIILSYIALGLGLLIVELVMNWYNNLIGREFDIHYFDNYYIIPFLLFLGLLVGIIAGSYPAFVLSSFKPVMVLKGSEGKTGASVIMRNYLVLFQFWISISLIIGTIIVFDQLDHLMNRDLGFDKHNVLVINNPGNFGKNLNTLKETLSKNANILNVSGSNTLPGMHFSNTGYGAEGVENYSLNNCVCDYDFKETLKLEIVKGRFFSKDYISDSCGVVINEKAAEILGWENPLGKLINNWSDTRGEFTIIGVVKDFHYESLHQVVRPQGLFLAGGYHRNNERFISVRIKPQDYQATIKYIEKTWNQFAAGKPFEYFFLEESYENLYMNEKQTWQLFLIFSILATFIACLGLYGLASFVADQKTKEIGIRKVLGASVTGLLLHFTSNFSKWVIYANFLAWPITYYIMSQWLQNFAYRTTITGAPFIIAAVSALIIALVTISFQAYKASTANPIDSLKYE